PVLQRLVPCRGGEPAGGGTPEDVAGRYELVGHRADRRGRGGRRGDRADLQRRAVGAVLGRPEAGHVVGGRRGHRERVGTGPADDRGDVEEDRHGRVGRGRGAQDGAEGRGGAVRQGLLRPRGVRDLDQLHGAGQVVLVPGRGALGGLDDRT